MYPNLFFLLETGSKLVDFMEFSSAEIAKALTLIEFEMFKKVGKHFLLFYKIWVTVWCRWLFFDRDILCCYLFSYFRSDADIHSCTLTLLNNIPIFWHFLVPTEFLAKIGWNSASISSGMSPHISRLINRFNEVFWKSVRYETASRGRDKRKGEGQRREREREENMREWVIFVATSHNICFSGILLGYDWDSHERRQISNKGTTEIHSHCMGMQMGLCSC